MAETWQQIRGASRLNWDDACAARRAWQVAKLERKVICATTPRSHWTMPPCD